MIRYLIDADCAIYAMSGSSLALRRRLEATVPGEIGLSAISLAEIELGRALGKGPPADVLDAFTRVVMPLPFDGAAARRYAQLPFKRARFDRLLAAHALSLAATVVSNNVNDFADVPGLVVENWTQ
jgi:tRNA(fMet)-specific endonuclease VapC